MDFDDSPGIELPWRRSALSECSCWRIAVNGNSITRGSLAKKKIMFLAKTKRPEKDIKVSAKELRKCFVSSLILLWQPKSAQSALSSTVFKI